MRRRNFITLVGGVAGWPLWARAQPSAKIPRVGILWHAGSPEGEGVLYDSLHQGFRELGYVSGQNVVFEERFPVNRRSAKALGIEIPPLVIARADQVIK